MGEWRYNSTILDESEWPVSCPGCFIPEERAPGAHWIGGWVGPRYGLDAVERKKIFTLQRIEPQPVTMPTELPRPLVG
jgi:hypothetical protein